MRMGDTSMPGKLEATGLRIVNNIFFVMMIAVNIAADVIPLNNVTTAQISARHETLLTPSGFTFAIWGLIYLLLFFFILYQDGIGRKKGDGDNPDLVHAVSVLFILSSAFNIGWVIAWHYDYMILSFLLIFSMWTTLILAYTRLKKEAKNSREHFCFQIPFSIYTAWISAAMAVNFLILIKTLTPPLLGISETTWSMGLIIGIGLFAEFILIRYRDFAFALTALWAIAGIFYHYAVELSKEYIHVDMLMLLAIIVGVLFVTLLITAWVQHNKPYMA